MELEWDEDKRQDALNERGLDFADFQRIEFDTLRTWQDFRNNYGEPRFMSYAYLDDRLHAFCWTRRGSKIRIISMRKANGRECTRYEAGEDPRHA